jgi:hypothetical protein
MDHGLAYELTGTRVYTEDRKQEQERKNRSPSPNPTGPTHPGAPPPPSCQLPLNWHVGSTSSTEYQQGHVSVFCLLSVSCALSCNKFCKGNTGHGLGLRSGNFRGRHRGAGCAASLHPVPRSTGGCLAAGCRRPGPGLGPRLLPAPGAPGGLWALGRGRSSELRAPSGDGDGARRCTGIGIGIAYPDRRPSNQVLVSNQTGSAASEVRYLVFFQQRQHHRA